jgi:outer membrane protein
MRGRIEGACGHGAARLAFRSVAPTTLAVCWLVLGAPMPADAQGASVPQEPAPLVLTLDQALALAAGENPSVRRAVNDAGLNGTEMRTTWLDQLLPQASLTLFTTNFTGNLQRQAFDNFGNPIADPQAEWNYFSRTLHSVSLAWSFQGPSLWLAHRRQSLVNDTRDAVERVALNDVQVEVQRRYLDALEQRALMTAEEELLEARRIDLDVAERLFSLALRTRVDVLSAELAVEQQALVLQQQQTEYTRALLSLRTAMGSSDTRPIEVVETEVPIFDPTGLNAVDLISRALESSPDVLQSELGVRAAEVGLSEQKAQWWPRISAGVDVYKQAFREQGDALFDPSVTGDYESQFFVQFSIPVLDGLFRQGTEQAQASVELANRREDDREARMELEVTIRGALLDLANQWTSFRLAERSNEIAAEALRLAREEYRLGTRSFEEMRSAVEQEADTRRQVITARHGFFDTLLALEQAVGTPLRDRITVGEGEAPDFGSEAQARASEAPAGSER